MKRYRRILAGICLSMGILMSSWGYGEAAEADSQAAISESQPAAVSSPQEPQADVLQLKRSYLILNLTDMNDLPKADRWLFKDHANDTVSINGSILSGYATYRALPIPEGGKEYGAYNWRMTEHHWLQDPFPQGAELNQGTAYQEVWVDGYNEMIGNPTNSTKRADWGVQENKDAHPAAFVFTTRRINDDIKGYGVTSNDGPYFRFVVAMKYPEGVSQEAGEEWFYNSLVPALKQQKTLLRAFSYKAISPHVTPFTRIVELWYRDSKSWYQTWVTGDPEIPAPAWAAAGQNKLYLTPYKDMVSIFLEEAPERDFLRQGTSYYVDN